MNKYLFFIFFLFVIISYTQILYAQEIFVCKTLENNIISIKDFGADGNDFKDDSKAFLLAFQCAEEILNTTGKVIIKIPTGRYILSKKVPLFQKENVNWKSIRIVGDGIDHSEIYIENSGFEINLLQKDILIEVKDLSFVAAKEHAGKAILIQMPAGGNRHYRNLTIKNILIRGTSHKTNTFFNVGIEANGVWRPYLHNILMTGPYGPNAPFPSNSTCFLLQDTYSPEITNCACWSANIGIKIFSNKNPGPEGVQIISSKFVNVDIGIDIENVGIEPEGVIVNNHINARKYGLIIKGKKFIFINNNLFYIEKTYEKLTPIHMYLDKIEKAFIYNNIFHYPGKIKINSVSIKIGSGARDIFICDNIFNSPGTGIFVSKKAKNIKFTCVNEFYEINESKIVYSE